MKRNHHDYHHVWLFTLCYTLVSLYALLSSDGLLPYFLVYFYGILTPGLVWYAIWTYKSPTGDPAGATIFTICSRFCTHQRSIWCSSRPAAGCIASRG